MNRDTVNKSVLLLLVVFISATFMVAEISTQRLCRIFVRLQGAPKDNQGCGFICFRGP
jgi:hypothetical protein